MDMQRIRLNITSIFEFYAIPLLTRSLKMMLDFTFKHENYVDLIFCQLKNLYIHNSVLILPQADQHNITEMSCMIPPLACSSMHRRQRTESISTSLMCWKITVNSLRALKLSLVPLMAGNN